MRIAVKYQSFSEASNESTAIPVVSGGIEETLILISMRNEALSRYSILGKKLYCGCESSVVLRGHVFQRSLELL